MFWQDENGAIIADELGRPIDCVDCPCDEAGEPDCLPPSDEDGSGCGCVCYNLVGDCLIVDIDGFVDLVVDALNCPIGNYSMLNAEWLVDQFVSDGYVGWAGGACIWAIAPTGDFVEFLEVGQFYFEDMCDATFGTLGTLYVYAGQRVEDSTKCRITVELDAGAQGFWRWRTDLDYDNNDAAMTALLLAGLTLTLDTDGSDPIGVAPTTIEVRGCA